MKLPGIIVPVVTPCTSAGQPDETALGIVLEDLRSAGCEGFFVGSSTGRGPWFTLAQREDICCFAREDLGDSVTIAAGCMASGLPGMLENARAMADSGANIAVITAPAYYDYSSGELETLFFSFADKSPLPVMLYDIPGFARTTLDRDMIFRLARHERILGLKDSSGDAERFYKGLEKMSGLPKKQSDGTTFFQYQGKERYLAESLARGAAGFVVSMIHTNPVLFTGLYDAARSGDRDHAAGLQNRINRIMDVVEASFKARPETSTLFHLLEQTLHLRGIDVGIVLEHEGPCPRLIEEAAGSIYSIATGDE